MDRWLHREFNEFTDKWLVEFKDGLNDRWLDGWIDGYISRNWWIKSIIDGLNEWESKWMNG